MKFLLYPLIWILKIGATVFDFHSFNQEIAAILAGITSSVLLGGVYVGAPLAFLRIILSRKRQDLARKFERISFLLLVCAVLSTAISEFLGSQIIMIFTTSTIVIVTVVVSGLWMSKVFAMRTFKPQNVNSPRQMERFSYRICRGVWFKMPWWGRK